MITESRWSGILRGSVADVMEATVYPNLSMYAHMLLRFLVDNPSSVSTSHYGFSFGRPEDMT